MTSECQRTVLMADDDEEDCFLAKDAFSECGVKASFSCVEDGMELMDYLSVRALSTSCVLPDLILLDLNMPRKNGREALLEIKASPSLKNIPIVILTTSQEEGDISFTLGAGASSFITKPASFVEWIEIMKSLAKHWLSN